MDVLSDMQSKMEIVFCLGASYNYTHRIPAMFRSILSLVCIIISGVYAVAPVTYTSVYSADCIAIVSRSR